MAISVRAFHKPLADAGLIPSNCRLMDLKIDVSGPLVATYEVFIDVNQLGKLGEIFVSVAKAEAEIEEKRKHSDPPPRPPEDIDPGSY